MFERLKRRGALSEADVAEALREVRVALLEADVALPVVKDFIAAVKSRAVGQEVLHSVTPGQKVVKIVNDCLVETLGSAEDINLLAAPPVPVLMVGLQGSGKTTTSGKLALRLQDARQEEGAAGLARRLPPGRPAAIGDPRRARPDVGQPADRPRRDAGGRSPAAPWMPAGAKATTSSSSTPPAACPSTRR